ncbi:MAG: hypothetical protein ACD_50C00254G0001 [uncultured bacterium]|uniref:Repressor in ring oxydation complex/ phenylacetic acid degradation pathway related protein (PaaX) n=1 Tax=Candidatus Woesebacteria bacterium GW2011_GWA1_41_13b TaxID=1618555 RepID=A0A0G0XV70_9BACT|nr:MAG: hypothetical protein ACD_50C00254G0001 [uncultured bacterium]KKR91792.1 MAG: Repressor in ring oxydation complex/ phenylacetic acid degradation pathway related protein (PaaX) [Candidatus Woesebacteria bacterium GW2011_GWA1_41_13b]OGH14439.1 MAG: CRISPR-associated endonuclease Cas2 [Candidatus Levybacteria bacterium RIFCSPHIGHO2_01_FULL_38_96]OGH27889.1 MAG: CRISPR-associated endonuclease Cas2 [Candidatus Levybacteria bacterium RIFCSPHIGHO2_02_FULL_39_36]OGH45551.1 MAG: CRISPR-associated
MKVRKGSLGYWVLLSLEGMVEGLEAFSYSGQMRSMLNLPSNAKQSSLAQAIRRLRRNGLIEQEMDEQGKTILKLSELGKDFLGRKEAWDGRYRIIIWDIPEKKRRIRDLFRRRLRDWGFKSWQRSVWVSKQNVTDKLRKLIKDLDIESWVAVIESDDSSLSYINFHDRGK